MRKFIHQTKNLIGQSHRPTRKMQMMSDGFLAKNKSASLNELIFDSSCHRSHHSIGLVEGDSLGRLYFLATALLTTI